MRKVKLKKKEKETEAAPLCEKKFPSSGISYKKLHTNLKYFQNHQHKNTNPTQPC